MTTVCQQDFWGTKNLRAEQDQFFVPSFTR